MAVFRVSTLIPHIVAWLLFMSFPMLFILQGTSSLQSLNLIRLPWAYFQFLLLFTGIFYVNAFYLFPRFFIKGAYAMYTLCMLLIIALVLFIKPFDDLINGVRQGLSRGSRIIFFDVVSFVIVIMILGMSATLRSIREWEMIQKRAIIAETERAHAQLSMLKAQIHPHFLYNTLNNIYTLCLNSHQNAAASILKLSHIMRYVTEEPEGHFVPLQCELRCIDNYIALQKLRLGKKTTLRYQVSGKPDHLQVPPMALMTFIENIFKYGLSNHRETQLLICIRMEAPTLHLYTENTIFDASKIDQRKGLGIANVNQRLELLYPGRHELKINKTNKQFKVSLTLHEPTAVNLYRH